MALPAKGLRSKHWHQISSREEHYKPHYFHEPYILTRWDTIVNLRGAKVFTSMVLSLENELIHGCKLKQNLKRIFHEHLGCLQQMCIRQRFLQQCDNTVVQIQSLAMLFYNINKEPWPYIQVSTPLTFENEMIICWIS